MDSRGRFSRRLLGLGRFLGPERSLLAGELETAVTAGDDSYPGGLVLALFVIWFGVWILNYVRRRETSVAIGDVVLAMRGADWAGTSAVVLNASAPMAVMLLSDRKSVV